ncbi:MAG: prepilin-type N-terminal cleavage/methylation domain-containing protein, partial [Planctomycetota bacterium]|nr:prepilin-type N-terminal cleavage/methylation domain-containing protein [Planctomycetota bacterium]
MNNPSITPRSSRRLRRGFTLIEVIVAVTIIAILAAIF